MILTNICSGILQLDMATSHSCSTCSTPPAFYVPTKTLNFLLMWTSENSCTSNSRWSPMTLTWSCSLTAARPRPPSSLTPSQNTCSLMAGTRTESFYYSVKSLEILQKLLGQLLCFSSILIRTFTVLTYSLTHALTYYLTKIDSHSLTLIHSLTRSFIHSE